MLCTSVNSSLSVVAIEDDPAVRGGEEADKVVERPAEELRG